MNINHPTEESFENTLIVLFQDLGYQNKCEYNVERVFATHSFQS